MMGASGNEERTGAMWKATIRGLLARRVRLVLTALAVLLGVAFVSATYVLTDTVKRSFDGVFAQTLSGVDLQVQGLRELDRGDPPRIPDRALDEVRAVPGVARAEGFVTGYAQFVDRDGESIGGGGPPTFGASWVDDGPFRLVDDGVSRPPRRAGEVAMDAATASDNGFQVGDRVRVLLQGPAREYRIVGLFGFGDRYDFGAVTFAAFDLETAQRVFDAPRVLDRIYVQREPDVPVRVLQARLERALGGRYDVLTAAEAVRQVGETVRNFLSFFTYALLGFAAIGVVVGAFVIFNTFTILVTQRTRELGLLRAMGATGRQVVWSVVLEALVVGALASVVGLLVGIGLGVGLLELLRAVGLKLPQTSTVLLARTVVVSLAVGVIVTVVAAVLPAVRAARVPPVAAINDVQVRGARWLPASGDLRPCRHARERRGAGLRARPRRGGHRRARPGAGGRARRLRGARRDRDAARHRRASARGRCRVAAPRARSQRSPGARQRHAQPAPHRGDRVRAGHRARARRAHRDLRRVGEGVGTTRHRRRAPRGLRGEDRRLRQLLERGGRRAWRHSPTWRPSCRCGSPTAPSATTSRPWAVSTSAHSTSVVDLDFVAGGTRGLEDGGVLVDDETAARHGLRVGEQAVVQFSRGSLPLTVRGIYRNENFIGIFGQAIPVLVARESSKRRRAHRRTPWCS